MNAPTLDILTPAEATQLRADVQAAIGDGDVGKPLKLRTRAFPSTSLSTGVVTETFTNSYVRGVLTIAEEDLAKGIQAGDVFVLVAANDMTLDPNAADEIVDGTLVYRILRVEKDPTISVWRFHARREGTK